MTVKAVKSIKPLEVSKPPKAPKAANYEEDLNLKMKQLKQEREM